MPKVFKFIVFIFIIIINKLPSVTSVPTDRGIYNLREERRDIKPYRENVIGPHTGHWGTGSTQLRHTCCQPQNSVLPHTAVGSGWEMGLLHTLLEGCWAHTHATGWGATQAGHTHTHTKGHTHTDTGTAAYSIHTARVAGTLGQYTGILGCHTCSTCHGYATLHTWLHMSITMSKPTVRCRHCQQRHNVRSSPSPSSG